MVSGLLQRGRVVAFRLPQIRSYAGTNRIRFKGCWGGVPISALNHTRPSDEREDTLLRRGVNGDKIRLLIIE